MKAKDLILMLQNEQPDAIVTVEQGKHVQDITDVVSSDNQMMLMLTTGTTIFFQAEKIRDGKNDGNNRH